VIKTTLGWVLGRGGGGGDERLGVARLCWLVGCTLTEEDRGESTEGHQGKVGGAYQLVQVRPHRGHLRGQSLQVDGGGLHEDRLHLPPQAPEHILQLGDLSDRVTLRRHTPGGGYCREASLNPKPSRR